MSKLLEDILVLDFSQFLSGPYASLRLADMGARVIKIERPGIGDICRTLYVSDVKIEVGESTIFHAINRNKESFTADIKDEAALKKIKSLIKKADVVMHNFRPGVMERIGLDYQAVKSINPAIVYAEINGYSNMGEWKDLPGQDLLLQSVSGLTHLSGNQDDQPTPMGVAAADILAGTHLVQGILSALLLREDTGVGAVVQVSMLESLIDFQFEVLADFLNNNHQEPQRSAINNGHAYKAAPYGIYQTADGYLALAACPIDLLGEYLDCPALSEYNMPDQWFNRRDEIKAILKSHLTGKTTAEWLAILEPKEIGCSDVYDYDDLLKSEGYKVMDIEQEVISGGHIVKTTRCPVRVDGAVLKYKKGAPLLGEDTEAIIKEFNLNN